MKRIHAQFYHDDGREALGTDGRTAPMDGRWNIQSAHAYAQEYGYSIRNIHPSYAGYRLFFGERYTDRECISAYQPLDRLDKRFVPSDIKG